MLTERENRLMKVFKEHPSEFCDSLHKTINTPLTEKEIEFIKCFREDPERAIKCLETILNERKKKTVNALAMP